MANLTPAEIAQLRAALESKRTELRRSLGVRGRPRPEDDERPIEDGDLAERAIEEQDSVAMAERDHALLDEIEAALARMDAGTYGISETTGEPIPLARLKAVPWARTGAREE